MEDNAPKVKSSSRDRLQKLMKEESRMVQGTFRFHECPGASLKVPMKKYKGKVYNVDLQDGEMATIPLWVARWINGYDASAQALDGKIHSCGYPIHSNAIDRVSGRSIIQIGQVRRRMAFESNEFMAV